MILQVLKNKAVRVTAELSSAEPGSTVTVDVYDMQLTQVVTSGVGVYSEGEWYFDVSATITSTLGTYTCNFSYVEVEGEEETVVETAVAYFDVVTNNYTRYCYQSDVRRKLFDIRLPVDFDLSMYTSRASNEIDRALQGLYDLPLVPDSTHANYERDVMSLMEMCSDIATSYAIEDMNISLGDGSRSFNLKKEAAFAELNRYVALKKVFYSVPQSTAKADLHYQNPKPTVVRPRYINGAGILGDDPMDSVYNNFGPYNPRE